MYHTLSPGEARGRSRGLFETFERGCGESGGVGGESVDLALGRRRDGVVERGEGEAEVVGGVGARTGARGGGRGVGDAEGVVDARRRLAEDGGGGRSRCDGVDGVAAKIEPVNGSSSSAAGARRVAAGERRIVTGEGTRNVSDSTRSMTPSLGREDDVSSSSLRRRRRHRLGRSDCRCFRPR